MTFREKRQQAHATYHAQQEAEALMTAMSDTANSDYYTQSAAGQKVSKNNKMLYIYLAAIVVVGAYLMMDSKPKKKKR